MTRRLTHAAPAPPSKSPDLEATQNQDKTTTCDTRLDMNGATDEILPVPGKKNVLITSALPYVNNVPHLGNVIGRYCKARGHPTLFVCGTDEYGTATETKAIEEGLTPQELCSKYNKIHKEVYDWFEIGFDKFGRTPTQEQTDIAQDIFTKLHKNGYLEERTTTQPYCEAENHQAFLADRFVEGECPLCGYGDARGDQCDKCGHLLDPLDLINPRCKLDGRSPVKRETKHAFILLDKLQEKVTNWSQESFAKGGWSENGVSITNAWLSEGLKPRGITRDLKWGTAVPLPGYENKVMYVWFDACIGYVSITATYTKHWEKWWRDPENVKLYQFMGKDNVPFHSVVFPCSQLGTGDKWTMVDTISTTEYLNYEHGKFSKSRGIGVFGTSAKETGIAPDVWRYFLLLRRPETSDTEFEWDGFIAANNNELVNNFGNFVNRILKFVNSEKTYNSVIPELPNLESRDDYQTISNRRKQHMEEANTILQTYRDQMDAVRLKAGLISARELSSLGNKLLQDNRLDNTLFNNDRALCDTVVNLAANHVHLLASVIEPYIPATSRSILTQLNADLLTIPDDWQASSIQPGHTIGKAQHLFKNIKPEKEQEWRELFGGDELKKQKEAEAAKKAARKAEKDAKKAKKAAEKGKESVEAVEKDGAQSNPKAGEAVEEVTEGVRQATLQTS
ncbi:uncharacterized protein LTR77_004476 [Saxophila tyrrhenica]|uniref:methionine--tRNA ligase n=1 Tax=Saxophila tyrrhenica TaxID=1690608 RepID=A0AAV9PCW4_9PEZI|nr:hypothetical protein LTR77_004476 [Saxophila tyrrhenica]